MKDCDECCIGCEFYTTAKERNLCETYRARIKDIRHRSYMLKKSAKVDRTDKLIKDITELVR
jgi:acetolactate synthase small subunit